MAPGSSVANSAVPPLDRAYRELRGEFARLAQRIRALLPATANPVFAEVVTASLSRLSGEIDRSGSDSENKKRKRKSRSRADNRCCDSCDCCECSCDCCECGAEQAGCCGEDAGCGHSCGCCDSCGCGDCHC